MNAVHKWTSATVCSILLFYGKRLDGVCNRRIVNFLSLSGWSRRVLLCKWSSCLVWRIGYGLFYLLSSGCDPLCGHGRTNGEWKAFTGRHSFRNETMFKTTPNPTIEDATRSNGRQLRGYLIDLVVLCGPGHVDVFLDRTVSVCLHIYVPKKTWTFFTVFQFDGPDQFDGPGSPGGARWQKLVRYFNADNRWLHKVGNFLVTCVPFTSVAWAFSTVNIF